MKQGKCLSVAGVCVGLCRWWSGKVSLRMVIKLEQKKKKQKKKNKKTKLEQRLGQREGAGHTET